MTLLNLGGGMLSGILLRGYADFLFVEGKIAAVSINTIMPHPKYNAYILVDMPTWRKGTKKTKQIIAKFEAYKNHEPALPYTGKLQTGSVAITHNEFQKILETYHVSTN